MSKTLCFGLVALTMFVCGGSDTDVSDAAALEGRWTFIECETALVGIYFRMN